MMTKARIAVAGAGLIGRQHMARLRAADSALLAAVVDPAEPARALAAAEGVLWYPSLGALFAAGKPDGLIIATPNQLHEANGVEAIAAGVPTLVEKPIADSVASAERLVAAAEKAGVPLAVGHHRRHSAAIQRAKAIIESGRLGRIVSVHACGWLFKPDDYFDVAWRRQPGAGPILVNLIHDIDTLRYLVGDIDDVTARTSAVVRGNPVEETAVVTMRFAGGAIGTANISDTIVAPWSYEHTAGENPAYPRTDQYALVIGGTHASLSVPRLDVWSNVDRRGWFEPFQLTRDVAADADPLVRQLAQFVRVVRGQEAPLVPGREGLETLRVIEAIKRSAAAV
jgi:predicted dehydrogenase